ncbi:hypothetical protein [Metabacillus litoralis]|jgi:hypothetical protein|uniref:hypothetical protein n=1 Tax=Metabacillus litoralis TaxID=152268 RepID=UPI00203F1AF3|nr:hypothetical protein [Metabacillus litoralis]MCM3653766.1 hypothetical protein [Metabacillus litoralis]
MNSLSCSSANPYHAQFFKLEQYGQRNEGIKHAEELSLIYSTGILERRLKLKVS